MVNSSESYGRYKKSLSFLLSLQDLIKLTFNVIVQLHLFLESPRVEGSLLPFGLFLANSLTLPVPLRPLFLLILLFLFLIFFIMLSRLKFHIDVPDFICKDKVLVFPLDPRRLRPIFYFAYLQAL